MRRALLAIDVGGSTSRAFLVDFSGNVLGFGRAPGGNPASNDPGFAAGSIIAAVEAAVAEAGEPLDIAIAQIALAGPQKHVALDRLEAAFRAVGLHGAIVFAGDLSAMFASATPAADGYCIVAGTGAGAVRVRHHRVDRVADAAGWLLGDLGSGYWLGHQAARAAVADFDGRGPRTALTRAITDHFDIIWSEDRAGDSRPAPLRALTDAVYGMRPIELAQLAPVIFAHRDDPVAAGLIKGAEDYLVSDFRTVFDPAMAGPVALGGGVIAHLTDLPRRVAEIVQTAGRTAEIRPVLDGSVGAIVLALRASGVTVDEAMFQNVAASVAGRSRR